MHLVAHMHLLCIKKLVEASGRTSASYSSEQLFEAGYFLSSYVTSYYSVSVPQEK